MRRLSIAIGSYGLTRALKDKSVTSKRLPLDFVEVSPITAGMRRMVRSLDLDVCEMAFTTYLCAKALGKPITAIPVFLTRNFHHWAAFHKMSAGIRAPKDLEGRRVVVNRGYTVTTGLWVRGILESEYGVDLGKITWMPTDEEHVAEYRAPTNVDYAWRGKASRELLLSGAADAGIGDIKTDSPAIRPLIPQARQAGFDYYRRTGIYPINHAVVVRNDILDAEPTVGAELVALFTAAKVLYLAQLASGTAQSSDEETVREVGRLVGGDPFPYGIAANRKSIEAIVEFAVDQQVIPHKLDLDQLFAPGTLGDLEHSGSRLGGKGIMTIGFRIARRTRQVDGVLVAKFKSLPLANVSDSMWRMAAGGPRLRPMHGGGVLAGPALTVKTRPGDNLMVHKAIDMAAPGDVIVIDAGGDLTTAVIGEMMATHAAIRGVAGLVINGAIRDSGALRAGHFPIFAAGVTHRGPYKDGPGEINVAIALDGMVIEPGDLVLGDDDGVLCVPFDAAETVYAAAKAKSEAEEKQMAAIKAGSIDRNWVDAALQRLGCEIAGN